MAGNTFGHIFRLTTFGESHGGAIGGVIDGCPARVAVDAETVQHDLDRRRPGQSSIVTQRKETDEVTFHSGIKDGLTLGTPIGFTIPNKDQKSQDYDHLKDAYRPSHADMTYQEKYGIRDHAGGGRSSARETACRVVGGAVAKALLKQGGTTVDAYVSQVGHVEVEKPYTELDLDRREENPVRCPDPEKAAEMEELIREVRKAGDTIGGIITGVIRNVPVGLGEPVFDKLHAELGKAMLSINAVKGFDIGSGFEGIGMRGSEHNDAFYREGDHLRTRTNYSGGTQGGISNGEDIYFRVAFKPVATIMSDQESVNEKGEAATVKGKGRHDPCVLLRAVPIVEAMGALVMADHWLRHRVQMTGERTKEEDL